MLDPGDGSVPAMQRTRVSPSTHATAGRIVAILAMAAAAWTGCNLVPQTLPPDNGLGAAGSLPNANETDGGFLVLADASVGASSSGGAFGLGGSGGGSGASPVTGSSASDAAATLTPAPDAAGVADAGVAADAGSAGDAGTIGNPGLDGAPDGAEPDATSGAFQDSGDNFNDASPADASDDVSLE
jgi:hypothetical protein